MSWWQKLKMAFGWKPSVEDIIKNHDGPVTIAIPKPPPLPANTRFDKALAYVLINEGGFTDDRRDPGGPTQWGIIKKEYEHWLGRELAPDEVRKMPFSTAIEIYKKNFWNVIKGDEYDSDAKAIAIMDTAVNKGIGGCMDCIKDSLNNHSLSRFGDDTIQNVNMVSSSYFLGRFSASVLHYNAQRIVKYPHMEWARKGWNNRANRLLELIK